jgi:hypothetical protein
LVDIKINGKHSVLLTPPSGGEMNEAEARISIMGEWRATHVSASNEMWHLQQKSGRRTSNEPFAPFTIYNKKGQITVSNVHCLLVEGHICPAVRK